MENFLAVTALGTDKNKLVEKFSKFSTTCGCNILKTKMTKLGSEFAILILFTGTWNCIAKLETLLPKIEKRLNIVTTATRTKDANLTDNWKCISYNIEILSIDKPDILHNLSKFLSSAGVEIEEVSGNTFFSQNGTKMVSMNIHININENIKLSDFRDNFIIYCDNQNIDGNLEPIR